MKRRSTTRKIMEDAVIGGLLATGTIAGAAKASGFAENTVRKLIRLPKFRARLDRMRNVALQGIVTGLIGSAGDALACLRKNLSCGNPSVEVKAAMAILGAGPQYDTHRASTEELAELRAKFESIEAAMKGGTAS